jgi:hypothetical protein
MVGRAAGRTNSTPMKRTITVFAAFASESGASRAASLAGAYLSSERLGRHRWVVERTLAWL